jgi:glycosyltransferase involved in cell wall biosynthesis
MHGAHPFFREQPWRTLVRGAQAMTARTIAISDEVARFLRDERLCRPEAIRVVRYGIDASGWPLSDGERGAARARLGLGPDEVAVGIASRLVPGKGHDLAIDALAAAREREPQLRLLVAGDGPERGALERRAESTGDGVRFLGFVDGIRDFMGACDVFLFPTEPWWGEGFGLAALEAMAVGLPLVATPVGGLPEMIHAGETGFLVPPRDVGRLSEVLVTLANRDDLRRDLGRRARRRVEREFSLALMRDRTLEVYREAVAGIDRAGRGRPRKLS